MSRNARIAVVDDHPMVRKGLVATFRELTGFEIVGEGASADDAVEIARTQNPDVMLIDVTMPGGGIEAAIRIKQIGPHIAVVILSICDDFATVRSALAAGVKGYVSKGVDGSDLVDATRRVLSGERYVTPNMAAQLLAGVEPPAVATGAENLSVLNDREQQILNAVGEGYSNQEIANLLDLSENTVKHYMKFVLQKLGARNRTEAALIARRRMEPSS